MFTYHYFDILRMDNRFALEDVAKVLEEEIIKVVPRDQNRLPKDPSKSVTGTLRRSIITKIEGNSAYAGVSENGLQVPYALRQEYGGWSKHTKNGKTWHIYVPPRSYIRLTKDNSEVQKKLFTTYQNALKKLG